MDRYVVWYIRMSLIFFVLANIFGIGMVIEPEWRVHYRATHVHFNLLGWMSMMIYGVGYHILPKFSGRYIYSVAVQNIQFWFSTLGLLGMGTGWSMIGRDMAPGTGQSILLISSLATLVGVAMFAFNIGMTVAEAKKVPPVKPAP